MKAQIKKSNLLLVLTLSATFISCQEEQFFQKDLSLAAGNTTDVIKTPGDHVIIDAGKTETIPGDNGSGTGDNGSGTGDNGSGTGDNGSGTGDNGSGTGDNGSGEVVVNPDPVIPIPPKDCGEIKHLEFNSRTMFKNGSVAFGNSCQSELQLAQCNDGTFDDWSGNFQYSNCKIQDPLNCGNINHGEAEVRLMYQSSNVAYGSSCTGERQTRICNNGQFADWSGTFQSESCIVESLKVKQVTEQFTQNSASQGKVDILWMVDNSGSMRDEQTALAQNFDRFISNFLSEKIDFKMGITTTDIRSSYSGVSRCAFDKLDANAALQNEALFTTDFKKCIQVGTNGYSVEAGLTTSRDFLRRYSTNFLRQDAYLIIVMISDEPEQSRESVETLVGQIKAYKNNSGLLKIYSIVHTNRRDGERYLQATSSTGGKSGDIMGNFSEILKEMGDKIVELTSSFALKSIPYDDRIEVMVNGTIVTSGWRIDTESGTLKFDSNSLPAEGSTISIKYNAKI